MCTCKNRSRRKFLGDMALGTGGLVLGSMLPRQLLAAPLTQRRFIFAYFEGGWDILLGLDPRDPATTNAAQHKIEPNYGALTYGYASRGVQRRGELSFGPAVPAALLAHASKVSIVNGIGMDTAAHEVGRRYFITGQFPRGLAAVGSSASAEIVAQMGEQTPVPHLAAGVEAYARGKPSFASPLSVSGLTDLLVALRPFIAVDPTVLAAVRAYQDDPMSCEGEQLDRDGLTSALRYNQGRARMYIESQLDRVFSVYERTDAEMTALRSLYNIDAAGGDSGAPEVMAFAAAQAVKGGVSQSVSVTIGRDLDTHSDWADDQAPRQERGWSALAAMLTDLEQTPLPGDASRSMLDETTVLVFSEFGRTPMFNNVNGRDHFLGNSCLVAGAGIHRGRTVGRSASVGMMPVVTHLDTGAGIEQPTEAQLADPRIVTLTPKHVLATILASANLDYSYLRVDPIAALLG